MDDFILKKALRKGNLFSSSQDGSHLRWDEFMYVKSLRRYSGRTRSRQTFGHFFLGFDAIATKRCSPVIQL